MMILRNPTIKGFHEVCKISKHNAAKWIKDAEDGTIWCWPAEEMHHSAFAEQMHIRDFTKGIIIPNDEAAQS